MWDLITGIFEFRLTCRAAAWFQPERVLYREKRSLLFPLRISLVGERRLYVVRYKREKRNGSIEKFRIVRTWLNVINFFNFSKIFFFKEINRANIVYKLLNYRTFSFFFLFIIYNLADICIVPFNRTLCAHRISHSNKDLGFLY